MSAPPRRCDAGVIRDSLMPMTTMFVVFLMIGSWALLSASQQWDAQDAKSTRLPPPQHVPERRAMSPESAMAACSTQSSRTGRAESMIAVSGYSGTVCVDGIAVTVTVTGGVAYAFPSPGFPDQVTGTASAIARRGVTGTEGG